MECAFKNRRKEARGGPPEGQVVAQEDPAGRPRPNYLHYKTQGGHACGAWHDDQHLIGSSKTDQSGCQSRPIEKRHPTKSVAFFIERHGAELKEKRRAKQQLRSRNRLPNSSSPQTVTMLGIFPYRTTRMSRRENRQAFKFF